MFGIPNNSFEVTTWVWEKGNVSLCVMILNEEKLL